MPNRSSARVDSISNDQRRLHDCMVVVAAGEFVAIIVGTTASGDLSVALQRARNLRELAQSTVFISV